MHTYSTCIIIYNLMYVQLIFVTNRPLICTFACLINSCFFSLLSVCMCCGNLSNLFLRTVFQCIYAQEYSAWNTVSVFVVKKVCSGTKRNQTLGPRVSATSSPVLVNHIATVHHRFYRQTGSGVSF